MLGRVLVRRSGLRHARCGARPPISSRRSLSTASAAATGAAGHRDSVSERQRAAWASSSGGSGWDEGEDAVGETQREALLRGAIAHVPTYGWSSRAIAAAATEQGLSSASVGLVNRGPVELAEFFADQCNSALAAELAARQDELLAIPVKERLVIMVRLRLEMLVPHLNTWPQAIALLSKPESLPATLSRAHGMIDAMWLAAGDTSDDHNYHVKRLLLAAV